ncbi:MAG TPA: cytochrome d ubiquinol oxidase subunit II, partial [Syntrophobacteria bacterium]|nr:cytochrome d ubiquinol oxidase subunit II [Syntrophobacteria bacterium]
LVVIAVMFLAATSGATRLYDNYLQMPLLFVVPLLAVLALFMTRVFIGRAAWWKAWWASSLTIIAATLFGVIGLYPNLLPSSLDAAASATVANASSSPLTLKIMLVVALIFVPVVILYQAWVYRLFSGKVREEDLLYDQAH